MALYCQLISPPSLTFKRLSPLNRSLVGSYSNIIARASRSVLKCIATTKTFDETIVRRSTNYPPSIWPRDCVQSLTSNHVEVEEMGLGDLFSSFARDSWMVSFFWAVGMIFEPQYGYCRSISGVVNALITTMDDVSDVYGTMDELELLTMSLTDLYEIHYD
ncbi:hypothetical protein Patl1_11586 [Pistacia atlantica]|uniref:Uncharacterized protein n=1 Tax=Pistacia atlantica TaxID=434234 RepID=A0ACC1A488_9ROSI|nr:hypothetical protein Patl1_11586 [Pistacia atlantica]